MLSWPLLTPRLTDSYQTTSVLPRPHQSPNSTSQHNTKRPTRALSFCPDNRALIYHHACADLPSLGHLSAGFYLCVYLFPQVAYNYIPVDLYLGVITQTQGR